MRLIIMFSPNSSLALVMHKEAISEKAIIYFFLTLMSSWHLSIISCPPTLLQLMFEALNFSIRTSLISFSLSPNIYTTVYEFLVWFPALLCIWFFEGFLKSDIYWAIPIIVGIVNDARNISSNLMPCASCMSLTMRPEIWDNNKESSPFSNKLSS